MKWTQEKDTKLELILYRLLVLIKRTQETPFLFLEAEFVDIHNRIKDLFTK